METPWQCAACEGPWLGGGGRRRRKTCSEACAIARRITRQRERRNAAAKVAFTTADRSRVVGSRVVASVSGGKDSAALSLWLTEQGIEHDRIFADTGWEHPETYRYIDEVLEPALGPIARVRGKLLMPELIRHKKMFPSRVRRFCTQELKVRPLARWFRDQDDDMVNAVGIRGAESKSRAGLPRWEYSKEFDADVWRPLIDWSEADVIAMHRRHSLAPNPLYLMGAERVGCWPCIFSRKREIRRVSELTSWRIDQIRELEAELGDGAELRMEADGKFRNRPTFFHPKGHDPSRNDFVPIDRVVAWSKTAYGGKQLLLLDTEPAGCVRWGLCEGAPAEAPPANDWQCSECPSTVAAGARRREVCSEACRAKRRARLQRERRAA